MINLPLADELPANAPFWTDQVTIAIFADGHLYSSHRKGEKERMLRDLAPAADCILATWHGQYRSFIFTISMDRVQVELLNR